MQAEHWPGINVVMVTTPIPRGLRSLGVAGEKAGLPLPCGFNWHFDYGMIGVRDQVKEGQVGMGTLSR